MAWTCNVLSSVGLLATLLLVLEAAVPAASRPLLSEVNPDLSVRRIAFGSCNKHDRSQSYWPHIQENRPDLFVWLGDAVYNDQKVVPWWWSASSPTVRLHCFASVSNVDHFI